MKSNISYFSIFYIFFKIALFTLGGGYVMLPIMRDEIVNKRKWLNDEEMVDIFAISNSVPGIIAVNTAMQIGYRIKGILGAFVCILAIITPSFFIILFVFTFLNDIKDSIVVKKIFLGIRSGVTALIIIAGIKLAKKSIKNKIQISISLISFLMIVIFSVNPIYVIIGGAITGLIVFYILGVEYYD